MAGLVELIGCQSNNQLPDYQITQSPDSPRVILLTLLWRKVGADCRSLDPDCGRAHFTTVDHGRQQIQDRGQPGQPVVRDVAAVRSVRLAGRVRGIETVHVRVRRLPGATVM